MKKLLSCVSLSALALCLPLENVHAMKRELKDESVPKKTIGKKTYESKLEEIVVSVPDELWSDIIKRYCFHPHFHDGLPSYSRASLVNKKWNELVTHMFLIGDVFHDCFSDLFISAHASKIVNLSLCNNHKVTNEALTKLVNLTRLDLSENDTITNKGIKDLTSLIELSLYGNRKVTINGFKRLTNIIELDLRESDDRGYGYEGIEALINLKELQLSTSFPDSILKKLTHLTDLNMNDNTVISDDGIQELTKLIKLDLGDSQSITNKAIKLFTNLTYLHVATNNTIADDGIKDLVNLKELHLLENSNITGSGFKKLTNITTLYFEPTDHNTPALTSEGINFLKNLTELNLRYVNTIGDDALRGLTNLTYLNVDYHIALTVDGIRDLPNLKPNIRQGVLEIKDLKDRAHTAYHACSPLQITFANQSLLIPRNPNIQLKYYSEVVGLLYELKIKYEHHVTDEDRRIFEYASREQKKSLKDMHKEFNK